ncbi:MAG: M1 family aminopeptidase [Armatimonas sp.]
MRPLLIVALALPLSFNLSSLPALAQRTSPFSAPRAKIQYAPDREFDLRHVAVTLDIDYPHKKFTGTSKNFLTPLHSGMRQIKLHCGSSLDVSECRIGERLAFFKREGEFVVLEVGDTLPVGKEVVASVVYSGGSRQGDGFGSGGGFHWLTPSSTQPNKIGFWTQGETNYNREWAPTWDYPNDFATSETVTTVPADWVVIGNGKKLEDTVKDGKRTVHWKMTQPHATYLLSLAAGPMDQKRARWEGVELIYTVPKGSKDLIDASFSDTPRQLAFYSKITGVKFPWPKYAQNAVYDFGGGMENVSSTTLGAFSLAHPRDGYYPMASLNAHELAHQWFGDLVSCKDWGQAWLNESFADFFQWLYFENSRGKNSYDHEVEDGIQAYLRESQRYKRPIATNLYESPDDMFDSHTYPKGGAVLHTLRKQIGDEAFFKGINLYLTRNRHQPVETQDLIRAMTDASGVNLQPFFEQWVFKPGHPVLEYDWKWSGDAIHLNVRQTQDTTSGTPIYNIPTQVGIIRGGKVERVPVTLDSVSQDIRVPATVKPDAVILDPDHTFLAEWRHEFGAEERFSIALNAPNGVDREEAMNAVLMGSPTEGEIAAIADSVSKDMEQFPAIESLRALVNLKQESLRPLWRKMLTSASIGRRADACRALGQLEKNEEDLKTLRALALDDKQPFLVVATAVSTLGTLSPKENVDVFKKLAGISDRGGASAAVHAALKKAGVDVVGEQHN